MHAELLLSRLKGVRSRGPSAWIARCPAHKDRTPSLSITEHGDGRVLLHDFGGCEVASILEAVGLTFQALMPQQPIAHHVGGQHAGAHVHAAADALKVIAHEAFVVVIAARDMRAGALLTPDECERLFEAELRIRSAAHIATPAIR